MPKLWNETVEQHRHAVREAILEAAWGLVTERGLMSVTMTQVAEKAGIGRATLYKYFPDVETILSARHEQHVSRHLEQLTELRGRSGRPGERLEAVLDRYALICYHRGQHAPEELSALVHRGDGVAHAQQQLLSLFRDLLSEAADDGELRRDVDPDELANFCLHALSAAGSLRSEAAAHRLAAVTLAGLRA